MLLGGILALPLLIFFLCCDLVLYAVKQIFSLKMMLCPQPKDAGDCALVPSELE